MQASHCDQSKELALKITKSVGGGGDLQNYKVNKEASGLPRRCYLIHCKTDGGHARMNTEGMFFSVAEVLNSLRIYATVQCAD